MNWGKGIALTIGIFIFLMLGLVYLTTKQNFSLVTENYYEESLDHDTKQLKISNYKALQEEVKVVLDKDRSVLNIELPSLFDTKEIKGEVLLYNPTDNKQDRKVVLNESKTAIPIDELSSGLWRVMVEWTSEGKSYLAQKSQLLN